MNKREQAQKEWEQALKDSMAESEALLRKLKAEGRFEGGLDGNQKDFAPINEKLKRRMKEIQEKYKED